MNIYRQPKAYIFAGANASGMKNLNDLSYKEKEALFRSLKDIAEFHILFEKIHPFADGNGRIGRLLIAY